MAKYDDASWHYGGDYPAGLPQENASTHIGMFIAWAIDNGLLSEFQMEEAGEDVKLVLNREMTGRDFFIRNCDEKFTDEDLNDVGNLFAKDYYVEEGAFAKKISSYLNDFEAAVKFYHEAFKLPFSSAYHIEDSFEFYEAFKTIIDERFQQWQKFRNMA